MLIIVLSFLRPVAIAIEAETRVIQFYSGGVLDSSRCGTNRGVLTNSTPSSAMPPSGPPDPAVAIYN